MIQISFFSATVVISMSEPMNFTLASISISEKFKSRFGQPSRQHVLSKAQAVMSGLLYVPSQYHTPWYMISSGKRRESR